MAENRAWLTGHRDEIGRQRECWSRLESRWSWARLLVFLVGVAPWFVWAATPWIPTVLMVTAGFVFAWTVKRHHYCRGQRELRDGMLLVLDEALRRSGGKLEVIRSCQRPADLSDGTLDLPSVLESGSTWGLTDQERDDLDVFATPVGLFGLLNRTSTALGARRLRDLLDKPCLSAEWIRSRQAAVRWLEEHPEQRVRLTGAVTFLRNEDRRLVAFARAVHRARPLSLFAPVPALRVWGYITAVLALFALAQVCFGHFQWSWLLAGVVAVNFAVLRRVGRTLTETLAPWRDVAWAAQGFLVAVRQGVADLPIETELAKLRACFTAIVQPGYMPSLCRRIGGAEHGGGLHLVMNYLALYDVHVATGILKRVVPNRDALLRGLSALADLETRASLACFAVEQPVTCYPRPTQNAALQIINGCHPLIPPERVIPNTVQLTAASRMWIITGSNMAGKSTFLRMAGINVLLAQLGSAVVAREMTWSPLRLMTDLQARDDLARDESYFLAEVRHLRRMVFPPDDRGVVLSLIDEPFRGTNSQDQTAASVALLRYMLNSSTLVLLATHDRYLTELADGSTVRNYHFREDLSSDGMVFDYHLYDGPAQTRNALRVLEREGYPQQVLKDAHAWLTRAGDGTA